MHASLSAIVLCLFAFGLSGCNANQLASGGDVLAEIMSQQLGVTANQAKGGTGSMLTLAKEKLSAGDFSQLTKYLPNTENYVKSANDLKAITGPINDKAGLEAAFKNLGMGNDMVPKMSKTVSDFVGNSGGEAAKNFFASLMK